MPNSPLLHAFLFAALLSSAAQSLGALVPGAAPPKHEVRAVWLTTAAGLDWPRTADRAEQQTSLREIVHSLRLANFNTIFFQARARGDAYYRSAYEPWAENLTGTLGKDPGWDPLGFLITEAHRAGIEVHAWFNVYKVRGPGGFPATIPPHVSRAHPEWTVGYAGEGWLDPGLPQVRTYLINVALDLARNYDIDGINFDYVRYPGRDFPDGDVYKRYGGGMNRDDWRRSNIDRFVAESYDRLIAQKPLIKVGASPLGVYASEADPAAGAFRLFYQDARGWLRAGKLDYIAPQLYWDIGTTQGDPDFVSLLRDWQRHACGRQVYAGIGAYKPEVAREIPAQIDSTRGAGAAGESFYRYDNIRSMTQYGGRYDTPALVPSMPWKDALPPRSPTVLGVSEVTTNVFQLEWPAPSSAPPRRYIVYRSSSRQIAFDDPRAIVAITPGNETVFIDTVRSPTGPTFFYAVTAVDRGNNESAPCPVSGGTVKEFLSLRGKMSDVTALSVSLSTNGGTPILVAYSLARRESVELSLVALSAAAPDSLVGSLAGGTQDEGTYVVGMSGLQFGPGRYVVRLKAGESVLEQPIDLRR